MHCKCLLLTQSGHRPLPALFLNAIRWPVLCLGGGNETARQNRRQSSKSGTSQELRRCTTPDSVAPDEVTDVARLTRERDEAREQQTATAEILRVIRASPTDVQPVFDMIAESASRLCEAQFCFVYRFDGQLLHFVAHHSVSPKAVEINRRAFPQPPSRKSVAARAILEQSVVQISDVDADPDYALGELAAVCGYRSAIGVPILRDGASVGSIAIARAEAGLFPNRQVELLKTFADQAVIAIENVRLFSETKEALEQQTATSEVLSVISSSAGELQSVFGTVLENATRLCAAKFGNLYLCEGDAFRTTAMHNVPPAFAEVRRRNPLVHPEPGSVLYRLVGTKEAVHVSDVTAEQGYIERQPRFVTTVELGGFRSMLAVPMLKDGNIIGAIIIYRQEVGAFSDKQIELLKSFAAQAVIAIENTRLLNELRQRTDDLTESLEQQTATAEILQTINRSPGDVAPVFDAMVESAMHFCQADYGHVYSYEGEFFHLIAAHGEPRYLDWIKQTGPRLPENSLTLERVISGAPFVHIADIAEDDTYRSGNPRARTIVDKFDIHTLLTVALRKEDKLLGSFVLYRRVARPFSEKQVALVQNFAAQAVIAIENTRLLNELRQRTDDLTESLEQQTATSEVLRIISSSPGELESVFNSMLDNAVRICGARFGNLALYENGTMRLAAMHNAPLEFEKLRRGNPVVPLDISPLGAVVRTRQRLHVVDLTAEEPYARSALVKVAGARSMLAVPMLKDDELISAINIYRQKYVLSTTNRSRCLRTSARKPLSQSRTPAC